MRRIPAFGLLVAIAAIACSVERRQELATGSARQSIIGGSADTTRSGVVALLLSNGTDTASRCSGTIVRVAGTTGTVLTAAHCFSGTPTTVKIMVGASYDAPVSTFTATSWKLFPAPGGALSDRTHDLALIQFDGASASTPVVPLVPPSAYPAFAANAPLVIVGYGQADVDGAVPNTVRKQLPVSLVRFEQTLVTTASMTGSSCFGDSGGALLESSTGTERLAGVTKGGTSCGAGEENVAVGFYAPDISAWLRDNGFDAPAAAGQPNGADCTADDACASGACLEYQVVGGGTTDRCGAPLANGFVCQRAAQCASHYCTGGGCQACPTDVSCVDAGAPDAGAPDAGASDAGVFEDAGLDASVLDSGNDGGLSLDAGGSTPSAVLPGGGRGKDASSLFDEEAPDTSTSDASGCAMIPASSRSGSFVALVGLVLVVLRRRRLRRLRHLR